MTVLTFNCGEFKPGKRKIDPRKPDRPNPPIIIPIPPVKPKPPPTIPPYRPDDPPPKIPPRQPDVDPKQLWKCKIVGLDDLCPPEKPKLIAFGIKRSCFKCTQKDIKNKDPKCKWKTLPECRKNCPNDPPVCFGQKIPIIDTPGGGGRGIGDRPVITPRDVWTCKETELATSCPPGQQPDKKTYIKRECVQCTTQDIKNKIGDCAKGYAKIACERYSRNKKGCVSDTWNCTPITGVQDPDDSDKKTGNNFKVLPTPSRNPDVNRNIGDEIDVRSVASLVLESRDSSVIVSRKPPEDIDIDSEAGNLERGGDEKDFDTLYHPLYNLWAFTKSNVIEYVNNDQHLHVLNNVVAEEVSKILLYTSSNGPWREDAIAQLTTEKLAASVRPDLLAAFEEIHYAGGNIIGVEVFLEAVMGMLLRNRLDEFDATYILQLATRHAGDERQIIKTSINTIKNTQAGLGIIADRIKPLDPDPDQTQKKPGIDPNPVGPKRPLTPRITPSNPSQPITDDDRILYRRHKALNTDIDVNVKVIQIDGTEQRVPLTNAGIKFSKLNPIGVESSNDDNVEISEGDGYYFSGVALDGSTVIPVHTINEVSSAFVIPYEERFNALKLMDTDPLYHLRVSIPSGSTEFDTNYDTSSDLEPLYFRADLSSVGLEDSYHPLVTTTSGKFIRLTNASTIDRHAKAYGLGVVVVNIDHRDPMFVYASSVGELDFRMNDINFKNFISNRATSQNALLARGFPMGFVLRPVQGGKHNPFGAQSEIAEFRNNNVVRTLGFVPTIDLTDDDRIQTALDYDLTSERLGKFYLGALGKENPDVDNIVFYFETSSGKYKNSYFSNGNYSDDPKTRFRSAPGHLTRDIIEDVLKAKYNLNGLTWYDVWRRLTGARFHELAYDGPQSMSPWLSNGGKGVKISYVLNREPVEKTGIVSTKDENIVDTIIIEDRDREWVRNSRFIIRL